MKKQYLMIVSLLFLTFAGCGASALKISGSVSFDGAPLQDGGIVFVNESNPQTEFKEKIIGGKYEFAIPPKETGKYTVRIFATREEKPKNPPAVSEDMLKLNPSIGMETVQYIPKRYNTETTLSAEISSTATVFDFTLEK